MAGSANKGTWKKELESLGDTLKCGATMHVVMANVISPQQFYVQPVKAKKTAENFARSLKNCYRKWEHQGQIPVDLNDVYIGSVWCAKLPKDKLWCRVKVLKMKFDGDFLSLDASKQQPKSRQRKKKVTETDSSIWKLFVLLVDYGNTTWIDICDLRSLRQECYKTPAHVIHCSMVFVGSKCGRTTWDPEAGDRLREMTGSEPFVIQRVDTDKTDPISVLLWNFNCDPPKFINADLMIGILPESLENNHNIEASLEDNHNIDASPEDHHNIDASPEDHHNIDASPEDHHNIDAPPEGHHNIDASPEDHHNIDASLEYKANFDVALEDKAILDGTKKNQESNRCLTNFQQYESFLQCTDVPFSIRKKSCITMKPLKLPEIGKITHADVCVIYHPGRFVINFPANKDLEETDSDGNWQLPKDLFTLNEKMQQFYEDSGGNGDCQVRTKKELVACKSGVDSMWYRALIVDVRPDMDSILAYFVDYGNQEWISETCTRDIKHDFVRLPFQAVECCIANIEKWESDGAWPKEARDLFVRLVKGQETFAQIIKIGPNEVVVDLYSGAWKINIGQALINMRFAKMCSSPLEGSLTKVLLA